MSCRVDVLVEGSDVPPFRASSVLVSDGAMHLVIDPGASGHAPAMVSGLARNGLTVHDVQLVVATHLHYDHSENVALFANARVVVGAGELAALERVVDEACAATGLARSPQALEGPGAGELLDAVGDALKRSYQVGNGLYLNRIAKGLLKQLPLWSELQRAGERLTAVEEATSLHGDVRVLPTPGHTRGHLSVLVRRAEDGGSCLIAGDALPTERWMGREDASLPFCEDVAGFLATKRKLERVAERIVPGHGAMFAVPSVGRCA